MPAALALLLVITVLAPPVSGLAHRYDWVEALQFVVLALVAPCLFVIGAPWQHLHLGRLAGALAEGRRRHPERIRTAILAAVALACIVAWRTPAAVDRIHSGGWPVVLEAVSLAIAGTIIWLECLSSSPLNPRSTAPVRIALAAVCMWTVWITAYLLAMSHGNWYRAYPHPRGHGLSLAIDQQFAAGVLWAVAGACFIPFIFWTLVQWLRSEEDPDQEMYRLVREERRRAAPPHPTF